MTEKPLVSVIINCYNSEKYLRETIDSLIAQTYENWEAIFWDNCSTDKTAEIIASYNEPRFRYFLAEKNTPLGEARNLAMEKVQGELLCFLDSDDVWVKDFMEIGVNTLNNNAAVIGFFCNYYIRKEGRDTPYNLIKEDGFFSLKEVLHRGYGIGMSGCIVRWSIVKDYSILIDNRYSLIEDLDFFVKILNHGPFAYTAKPLFYYRVYNNNNSNKYKDKWAKEYRDFYEMLNREYVKATPPILSEKDIRYIRDLLLMIEMNRHIEENNRKEALMLLLMNRGLSIHFWSRILFVLFGKGVWKKLYSGIA